MRDDEPRSLIQDEFHWASPSYKRVHQRLNPSLANNESSGWKKLHAEKRCRLCSSGKALTRHHLVPQSWFLQRKPELRVLRNANANIVPLCRSCHDVVDGRAPVLRLKARAQLRAKLGNAEIAFILHIRGRGWLDNEYPRNP